jgi:hypothetical protein
MAVLGYLFNNLYAFNDDGTMDLSSFVLQDSTGADVKIYADGSAADIAHAKVYPNEGTNVSSFLDLIPKGTASSGDHAAINIYATDLVADDVNTESFELRATGTEYSLVANSGGAGAQRPIRLAASSDSANDLYITTGGNIGIGTNAPGVYDTVQSILEVNSGAASSLLSITSDNTYVQQLDFVDGTNSQWALSSRGDFDTPNNRLSLYALDGTNAEIATFLQSGNVGLGVNNPTEILHLQADTGTPTLLVENTGNNPAELALSGGRTTQDAICGRVNFLWDTNIVADIRGLAGSDTVNKDEGRIVFYTSAAGGTLTEALRITETQDATFAGDIRVKLNADNVSNPPTSAELTSIFGAPGTVGGGFMGLIDDNGAGTDFYHVYSDGTNWHTTGVGSVFGTYLQTATAAAETSTTLAAYQQKVRLTTGVVPAGDYYVEAQFNYSSDDENEYMKFQLELDDTTQLWEDLPAQKKKYADGVYNTQNFSDIVTLTNASHTFDLDYANSDGKTTYIKNARITIWRVS